MFAVTVKRPYAHMIYWRALNVLPMDYQVDYRGDLILHISDKWVGGKIDRKCHQLNYLSIWDVFTYDQWHEMSFDTKDKIVHEWLPCHLIAGEIELIDIKKRFKNPFTVNSKYAWIIQLKKKYSLQQAEIYKGEDCGLWPYLKRTNS